ncbi:MAG: diacylglycerol/lipid kinase family protein [Dichotomicrobium sp.]
MRDRFLIVHNPNAGAPRRDLMDAVTGGLEAANCVVEVRDAACDQGGRDIAFEAAKTGEVDAVVAAGGDGTIRSVAAGLRGTAMPVGLLPLGTGNVMAHEIGLSRKADAIVRCLREGVAVPAVGGTANDAPFFLMAGCGLDAEAIAGLNTPLKRRIGKLAYVWPVTREIFRPAPAIRAVLDGRRHSARWIVVCKAGRYAGGFTLSPDSDLFQPGLIAVLCTARSGTGLVLDILAIGAGYARRAPHITFVPFRRGHFSAERPIAVQVDGESFGTLPLTVAEDNLAVNILVPRDIAAARLKAWPQAAA